MSKAKLFQGFMQALRPALASGGINTGYSLLMGESLPVALLYGAADTLGSAGAVAGVRALKPGKNVQIKDTKTGKVSEQYQPSEWETPANFIASMGTGNLVNAALGRPSLFGGGQSSSQLSQQNIDPNNIDLTQFNDAELAQLTDEQILTILQQNKQRDMINNATDLAGKYASEYAPGTMFQSAGLPNRQSLRGEMMNTSVNANLGDIQQMMGAIAGV